MEKEQKFIDAAECYANAWNYCTHTDPSVGYKLSFNYLKGKRYVDAIIVATEVRYSDLLA